MYNPPEAKRLTETAIMTRVHKGRIAPKGKIFVVATVKHKGKKYTVFHLFDAIQVTSITLQLIKIRLCDAIKEKYNINEALHP